MRGRLISYWWLHPSTVWLVVLASVFSTEYTVMLGLPWLVPEEPSRFWEATVDALLLTAVLAPIMWWTVVRPLREVIRLRTRYLTDLFARVESNKKKVALELHDGVGQTLSLLVSGLRSAHKSITEPKEMERSQNLLNLAQTALKDVKRLALGLRPSLLDDLGLAPALERLVADVSAQHPLKISLDVKNIARVRLPEAMKTAVFRIVQEGLANVVAHAHARTASVSLSQTNGDLHIDIADDGRGFRSPDSKIGAQGHLGLLGMRERAMLFGGRFDIDTSRGTRISVTIPTSFRA
jgi:signal transduction histidine kinase